MPVIFVTGALLRPAFTAADFAATKCDTGKDKAKFANGLCRFIETDFRQTLFTERRYRGLAMTFVHIARFDCFGFLAEFFEDLRGRVAFLEQTLMWCPGGDPAWTYADVERAVVERLLTCDLLSAYRQLRAAEIEGAERELPSRLRAKYAGGAAPTKAPVLHCPPTAKPGTAARKPAEQSIQFRQGVPQRGRRRKGLGASTPRPGFAG